MSNKCAPAAPLRLLAVLKPPDQFADRLGTAEEHVLMLCVERLQAAER